MKGQIADIYSPTIGALTYSIVHQIAIIDRMRVRIIDTVGATSTRPTVPIIFAGNLHQNACQSYGSLQDTF